ncbi:histone-binding protein N1/N2-like isoform X2 [Festucalex cinctus]
MEEANKLIGAGKKHLVMGKVVEAVKTLQEACGILAKTYGDTADECAEAFFWCGKALLDLARMENSVLGNALEGVPEGDEDEKPKNSNVEGTENVNEKTRDELRVQVYDAMAEKAEDAPKKEKEEGDKKCEGELEESVADKTELRKETENKTEEAADKEEETAADKKAEEAANKMDASAMESDKMEEGGAGEKKEEPADKMEDGETEKKVEEPSEKMDDTAADKREEASDKMDAGESDKLADKKVEEPAEQMEEEEPAVEDDSVEGAEDEDDEEQVEDDDTGEKESDEEVGNLQLAWEMLEVAKVIYKRKESKEDQLMAAQAHLKLGEVSAESGNYARALEDFHECLSLQLKHLAADSRLIAETHYQLGLTFNLNQQCKEAIDELNRSIAVIEKRMANLTELIAKAAGPEELPDERREMEELKALLPDIQEKVEDAADGLKMPNAEAVKAALDGASASSAIGQSGDAPTASLTNGAPVSDISHLVRKKRKPEENPAEESVVKKVRQDDAPETYGMQKANGDTEAH